MKIMLVRVALLCLCIILITDTYARSPVLIGKQLKVVFFGNSITLGWKTHYPELFDGGYWENCGIGGQTTSQLLDRFEKDVLTVNPQVLVLMGGTNDIAGLGEAITVDGIFANISSMVELALKHRIAVVLCSVLPAHMFSCCPDAQPIPMIAALNAKLRSYAEQKKLFYVDYYSLLVDDRKGIGTAWTDDGVHPNKAGYARMLPITIASISETYGQYAKKNK